MPDQAPSAPEGCVYGPWWDSTWRHWFCLMDGTGGPCPCRLIPHKIDPVYGDTWAYEPSDGPPSREMLRLAHENAELRASQPSEKDMAALWLIREWQWTISKNTRGWLKVEWAEGDYVVRLISPADEARKLGWGG